MNQKDKMNSETAADQYLDQIIKEELTQLSPDCQRFLAQTDTAAFTEHIMEQIGREEETAERAQREKRLSEEEEMDIVTPLYCRQEKERKTMKSKKIFVAAIAAALCLTTATCFAFGKIGSFEGHSYRAGDEFPSITKMEQVLNVHPNMVENFSNGFQFTHYSVGEESSRDENGVMLETKPRVSLQYENDAKQWIALDIRPVFTGEVFGNKKATAITYGDITLYYFVQHHKFVPVNYEVTPEDQARMDAGELAMGYGADTVEECDMTNISWVEDGMYYSLIGQDLDLDEDDMVQMATEVISQGK